MNDTELVVIRTYLNKLEAEMAKSALDAANVDSMIQADDAGGMQASLWMGGVRLLVCAKDAERAAEILDPEK
jgi:hypothetical protein